MSILFLKELHKIVSFTITNLNDYGLNTCNFFIIFPFKDLSIVVVTLLAKIIGLKTISLFFIPYKFIEQEYIAVYMDKIGLKCHLGFLRPLG